MTKATAYHEGIPGHHMQLSVAQQLVACRSSASTARTRYIEGWRSMPEQLGKEVGF